MADLAAKLEPIARAVLDDGETLVGCCVATWQKAFSGGMVAVAVAPDRIVLQRLDRRFTPAGDPISLPPDQVERATVTAGVGRSVSIPSILMENVSITVELTTTGAGRIRMMLMGSGGEIQHAGIQALVAYLDRLG
jgi:hypothetical protein